MPQAPAEWTVLSMLEWATSYFEEKQIRNPRFSIEWILAYVLDVRRLDVYLMHERPLTKPELDVLRPLVKRRASHEPLQYITGETEFFNSTIKVKPGVLIPRMETEQLVEYVLEHHRSQTEFSVLDIGTGSGCIPIALKKAQPNWTVSAMDISEDALAIAKVNATLNETPISFVNDDLFKPRHFSGQQFDCIISNPPYILKEEKPTLDREVTDFEPSLALFTESIASMYGALLNFFTQHLKKSGFYYLELHEDHAEEVEAIFLKHGWQARIVKDYDAKSRFLVGSR